jgi:hypothetical protein
MKNPNVVKQVYQLVSDLYVAIPYLQFEVYTGSKPPEPIVELYIFGVATKGLPIGGFAIRADRLELTYPDLLVDIVQFLHLAWLSNTALYYPAEVEALYEMDEAGEEVWWQVV